MISGGEDCVVIRSEYGAMVIGKSFMCTVGSCCEESQSRSRDFGWSHGEPGLPLEVAIFFVFEKANGSVCLGIM